MKAADEPAPGAGKLAMALFLLSLAVLFAAALVAYLVVRLRADVWRPVGAPTIPAGLGWSTAWLVGCSLTIQRALAAVRTGRERLLRRYLAATLALALVFTASQVWNGYRFYRADVLFGSSLYGFTFYMLVGLHALHVIGGLIALAAVTWRAHRGAYDRAHHAGVRHTATYWHFLDAIWLVLLLVLVVG